MLNCWEFKKCGREKNCPAAKFTPADGFLGGKNAGRACAYVAGTYCNPIVFGKSQGNCLTCDFYKMLKVAHGSEASLLKFKRYIDSRTNISLPIYDLKA